MAGTVIRSSLAYDPLMRLQTVSTAAGGVKFLYDGLDMIAEYDSAGVLQKRHVFGPGMDEPLVEYAGSGTSARTFLHADERGNIVAVSDASGSLFAKSAYDVHISALIAGQPDAAVAGQKIMGTAKHVWGPIWGPIETRRKINISISYGYDVISSPLLAPFSPHAK